MRQLNKKYNFSNLRSQCYYKLSELVNDNKIFLNDADINDKQSIIEELEQIKQIDVDKDSTIKIISREDIKKNIGRSPDEASCLMMRMIFELIKKSNFAGNKILK